VVDADIATLSRKEMLWQSDEASEEELPAKEVEFIQHSIRVNDQRRSFFVGRVLTRTRSDLPTTDSRER
jgi:hypothetical protein